MVEIKDARADVRWNYEISERLRLEIERGENTQELAQKEHNLSLKSAFYDADSALFMRTGRRRHLLILAGSRVYQLAHDVLDTGHELLCSSSIPKNQLMIIEYPIDDRVEVSQSQVFIIEIINLPDSYLNYTVPNYASVKPLKKGII